MNWDKFKWLLPTASNYSVDQLSRHCLNYNGQEKWGNSLTTARATTSHHATAPTIPRALPTVYRLHPYCLPNTTSGRATNWKGSPFQRSEMLRLRKIYITSTDPGRPCVCRSEGNLERGLRVPPACRGWGACRGRWRTASPSRRRSSCPLSLASAGFLGGGVWGGGAAPVMGREEQALPRRRGTRRDGEGTPCASGDRRGEESRGEELDSKRKDRLHLGSDTVNSTFKLMNPSL